MTQMTHRIARAGAARHSLPDVQRLQVSIFQELRHREEARAASASGAAVKQRRKLLGGLFHTLACGASGLCPTLH